MCASHLITAVIFYKGVFALVAMPNKSRGHGFFHDMSYGKLVILFGLFAAQGNMRLFLAQPTADLLAFGIHASKLSIDFDRQAFCFEVAERTFR
jgi:hypothetical protein